MVLSGRWSEGEVLRQERVQGARMSWFLISKDYAVCSYEKIAGDCSSRPDWSSSTC